MTGSPAGRRQGEAARLRPTADEAAVAAAARFGRAVAIATPALALVTFGLALSALPNDVAYPFTSDVIADQWPGDYLWMFPAMLLMLLFVALLAAIHEYAAPDRKVFSLLGLAVAVAAAAVILIDYAIQVSVMQPSLQKGQLDGWSILTQYNPNGVFIALEELGYLLMGLALACVAPVFTTTDRLERWIRRVLVLGFATSVGALVVVSAVRGPDRGDWFEIIVISVVWLTLIVTGPPMAIVFNRATAAPGSPAK